MPVLSRRALVGLGLGTAALGVLGAAMHGYGHVGEYPPCPFPSKTLTAKTAAIFQVLGDFLVPPGGPLPGSAGDLVTLRLIDDFLTALPAHHRMLLEALAVVYEHGTALERFGSDRLTAMSPERRQAYLEDWARAGDLVHAQLFSALRMVYNMSYFERADVAAAMGIPQACRVLS